MGDGGTNGDWKLNKKWVEKSIDGLDDDIKQLEKKWNTACHQTCNKIEDRMDKLDQEWDIRLLRTEVKIDKLSDVVTNRLTEVEKVQASNIAIMKERARMWGMQGGAIPASLAIIVFVIGTLLKMLG